MRLYRQFHQIAIAEGVSYLILLLIAMPIKYGLGQPLPVKIVGWAHGALFIVYFIWLFRCWTSLKWPFKNIIWATLASLLPAGPFFLHQVLEKPISNED